MSKILILTTATGEGHNQAARSLKEILSNKYDKVEIFDFLEESKGVNDFVVGGYELTAKLFPHLYGLSYKISDFKFINRFLEYFSIKPRKCTLEYINKYNPDIIACTHPLAVCILGSLKRKKLINTPIVSIITDFKPHYTYFSTQMDAYITGSDYTKKELSTLGIKNDSIYPIGIPVREVFYHENNIREKNTDFFNILVMGGSMGLSGISSVLKQLVTNNNKLNITVVCGRNEELKRSLEEKYAKHRNLTILGFTDKISELMDSMNLIITKPGGLTTSETIHKNLPMIIPFVIPGQETDNAKFLCQENAAIWVKKTEDLNENINNLIKNPKRLLELKNNMKRLSEKHTINNIINLFENLK